VSTTTNYRPWLYRYILYNLFFVCLQFGFIFSQSSSFIQALAMPTFIYLELIGTMGIQIGLYFILSLIQTCLFWGVAHHTNLSTAALERWHLSIWVLCVGFIITSNSYFFPLSLFNQLLLIDLPPFLLNVMLIISSIFILILMLNALFWIGKSYRFLGILLSGGLLGWFSLVQYSPKPLAHELAKPNVILLGIDSLSPTLIGPQTTPNIDRFVKHSVYFNEVITPLAQTYPSWTSILTGLYPEHHYARYNLMPKRMVKTSNSIAWTLQSLGYQTLFATDDRRFNSIGPEFGFQTIIGPKMGVNDMLLGTFNDFPLGNLLINLPIGHWLFPYNHINRASHFSYYPRFFDRALQNELRLMDHNKAALIAIHFTLPHWPYAFASSSPADVKDEYSILEREQLYMHAVHQVDQQMANALQTLDQEGYLNNSIVILLSDHGETLYAPGSRQTKLNDYQGNRPNRLSDYFVRKTAATLERSAGHGSDLLSPTQYHCLLAYKIYQHHHAITQSHNIQTRVALIDIAPTILAYLGVAQPHPMDGISLLKALFFVDTHLEERAFIMESGMLPNQFLTREKARQLGQRFFVVEPTTGQLQIRGQELKALDAMKLYAILEGNWLLALYPDDNGYLPILQRVNDGKWVDDLEADFAKSSPANAMLQHLQSFYHHLWTISASPPPFNQSMKPFDQKLLEHSKGKRKQFLGIFWR
jgi:hypothetical protein